jgi:hypothetical protein
MIKVYVDTVNVHQDMANVPHDIVEKPAALVQVTNLHLWVAVFVRQLYDTRALGRGRGE